jgi:hypothetical protein
MIKNTAIPLLKYWLINVKVYSQIVHYKLTPAKSSKVVCFSNIAHSWPRMYSEKLNESDVGVQNAAKRLGPLLVLDAYQQYLPVLQSSSDLCWWHHRYVQG